MILYGHNMMDGSMFKPLISYLEPNFRGTHKDIFLEIDGRQYHYEVLAVVETSVKSTLYTFTDLSDPAEESRLPSGAAEGDRVGGCPPGLWLLDPLHL